MTRVRPLILLLLAGCSAPPPRPTVPAAPPEPQRVEAAGLHNVFRLSDRVYSGNSPEDDTGFASLERLGVKTVVSVDGTKPDVAAAERHGLRYVHLPIGYDGITAERAAELAKAVRDLPGPVYVHCHHGKHRGPAACAAVQLTLDPAWTPETAERWLAAAGTDPKYTGLVGLPRTFKTPTAAALDAAPGDFPATSPVPDLVRLMVEIDARWDHLKLAKAAGWKTPPDHPDVDPPHEAVQLGELFREAARLERTRGFAKEFVEAEAAAGELEEAIRRDDRAAAGRAFDRGTKACADCHAKWRDRK